jgi:hypothetical protein
MTEEERNQRDAVTTAPWHRRLYQVAWYRYTLLDDEGLPTKARVLTTTAWKIACGKRILFFPEEPLPPTSIFKVCLWAGHRIVTDPRAPHDAVFKWWDATLMPNSSLPREILGERHVVNLGCEDISKAVVGRVFAETFGYPIDIDPTTHRGQCVEKSDDNATHDGRILDCPIAAPRAGCVYQKLVDNLMDDGMYGILRVPVFSGVIPYVALGHRPVDQRFGNATRSTFLEPTDAFSAAEIARIADLCARMGLEYTELDVLRDRHDGRIYVCDVNATPWGGTALRRLPRAGQREALSRMARCLDALVHR